MSRIYGLFLEAVERAGDLLFAAVLFPFVVARVAREWNLIPDDPHDKKLESLGVIYLYPKWFQKLYWDNLGRRRELSLDLERTRKGLPPMKSPYSEEEKRELEMILGRPLDPRLRSQL